MVKYDVWCLVWGCVEVSMLVRSGSLSCRVFIIRVTGGGVDTQSVINTVILASFWGLGIFGGKAPVYALFGIPGCLLYSDGEYLNARK